MSTVRSAGTASRQIRILFVDDDELMRLSSIETLKELGYAAATAGTGRAALDYLQAGGGVDVLITDIGLPDIPGDELAIKVRALYPEVSVIFATGYDAQRIPRAAAPLQASVLAKPFAPAALAAAIAGAIERKTS